MSDLLVQEASLNPSVNLFLETRKLCLETNRSGEDHLTEFIAAALVENLDFRRAYIELTLSKPFPGAILTGVKPQPCYGGHGNPDMQLFLKGSDGKEIRVLVEHKIDAPEGTREFEDGERQFKGQLDGYLQIPKADALLYFRRSEKQPSKKVFENPKYIHPLNRPHFLWEDLYNILKGCKKGSYLIKCMQEGFEELGFLPPPKTFGDLYHSYKRQRVLNRKSFYSLLAHARTQLHMKYGWAQFDKDQNGNEMKCKNNNLSSAYRITVTGSQANSRFTIRYVPRVEEDGCLLQMKDRIEAAYSNEPAFKRVKEITGDRDGEKVPALLAEFQWLKTIMKDVSENEIQKRLTSLILPAAEAAKDRLNS